jgi:hypothetical protein
MSAEATLRVKASNANMPYRALQEVYNRGIGAFKTQPSSPAAKGVTSKEQWAFARTAAFINKKKSVYYGADNDIRLKYGLK